MNKPELSKLTPPVLIAHRGDNTRFPENTLASFNAAIKAGAEMIELDIALSRDRKMVVIHDDTLDRTTNGTGPVCEQTLSELKALDAGSWFDSQFREEQIPTLAEVMTLVDGQAMINVEIKKSAFENGAPGDAIEIQLLDLVKEMKLEDVVLISSFETRFLERIASLNPKLALGGISLEPVDTALIGELKSLGCYSWHGWCETIDEQQVKLAHDNGLKVFSFTVNKPEMLDKLCEMGVDGVFTDDCPLLRNRS